MFLPLGLNLRRQKILIIGAGAAAAHKLKTLQKYSADITLLAPEIKLKNRCKKIIKKYEPRDLAGYRLIYACTNDRGLNRQIAREARRRKILVNVCDAPALSDFISPAVFKRGYMSAAVFSDGRNVRKSIDWRDRISRLLDREPGTAR